MPPAKPRTSRSAPVRDKKAASPKKSAPKKAAPKKPRTTTTTTTTHPLRQSYGPGSRRAERTVRVLDKKTTKKATPKKEVKTAAEIAQSVSDASKPKKDSKKADQPVPSIRIRLSAFDHVVLDEATSKIVDTAERSGAVIHGPIPLPTKFRKFTVNKSTFVHKDSRDQYEMRTHRRLIDLTETTFKTIESLQNLSLPSGVDIEIKMG
ncbi:30S ribosomal protein S10 [Patescibacteria group bacterium]|nr:30S ribosomal protein S10 [Patescibacteria group bacterium]